MSKKDLVRFSVSVDWKLLKEFDEAILQEGYENRSFAVRTLFREFVLSKKTLNSDRKRGLFVILSVFEGPFCDLCEGFISVAVPLKNSKKLCLCIVEGDAATANKRFKEFSANRSIEYCKLIVVDAEND